MGGKTDIRWGDEEWAALGEFAASTGQSPGRAAKALVVDALGHVARRGGPAAPEERESGGAAAGRGVTGRDRAVSGASRPLELGTAPASSRPAGFTVGEVFERPAEYEAERVVAPSVPNVGRLSGVSERPTGSAGSTVPVPPAGGGAASVVESPPAADAPADGVSLVSAAAGSLVARGLAATPAAAQVLALRAIRSGQVEVSGEVCRDPARLVDPRELGVG